MLFAVPRLVLLATALLGTFFALLGGPSETTNSALAAAPACAKTTAPDTPASPAAGEPCWTDVDPYPFGADGGTVDTTSADCHPASSTGSGYQGDKTSCYLAVDSFAFRAWNRGLAATSPADNRSSSTAFGVWVFNGTRWFPDPTFPGQSVCQGNVVLWAGKRDYWLIGARSSSWPRICRFDGVNFEWQPLDIPKGTLDRLPLNLAGVRASGSITSGTCFSWDNCWFFGDYGVVVHWDGNVLSDASPDLLGQPWLSGGYTAATSRADAAGGPFGLAVSATAPQSSNSSTTGQQLPAQPGGTPPPQLFASAGGGFAPFAFSPPTESQHPVGDPYRTDLVDVDVDARGHGWVAGDPTGFRPGATDSLGGRRTAGKQVAPLIPIRRDGTVSPCRGTPEGAFSFTFGDVANGTDAYLWSSLSVFPFGSDALGGYPGDDPGGDYPGAGMPDVLAGGQLRPAVAGSGVNDDGKPEPAIVQAGCRGEPSVTRFRQPNPFAADQATGTSVPVDRTGFVTSVAANAANDAWAATTRGVLANPSSQPNAPAVLQRPHLYRLTDGQAPLAPASDDVEPRPLVFVPDPPIIIEIPPPEPPPAPAPASRVVKGAKKTKRLKAAVYGMHAGVKTVNGVSTLYLKFKVRRSVRIGLQALRHGKVVSRSGVKRFRGRSGHLTLKLDPKHWPTSVRLIGPGIKTKPTTAPRAFRSAGR